MSGPDRRYWDSNCFLAWLKGEAGRAPTCEEIIQLAHQGQIVIVTSAITLGEVVRPTQKGVRQLQESDEAKIQRFFKLPFLAYVDLNSTMGQATRELQWRHNLMVRDAVHVASALVAGVSAIETYDSDLLSLDRSKIPGCPVIRQPQGPSQGKLGWGGP